MPLRLGPLPTRGPEGVIPLHLLLDEAGQGAGALLEDVKKGGFDGAVGVVLVREGGEATKELPGGVAFGAQGRVQVDAGLDDVLRDVPKVERHMIMRKFHAASLYFIIY